MTIGKVIVNGVAGNQMMNSAAVQDSKSKDIQMQLTNKQQHLSRLTSDSEMTTEEKAKERQEIRRQIAELNRKLRMEQLDKEEAAKQEEKAEENKAALLAEQTGKIAEEDKTAEEEKAEKEVQEAEETKKEMQASSSRIRNMLLADSYMQMSRAEEAAGRMTEGKKGVLKAEIQSDKLQGTDPSAKKEELSELQRKGNHGIEIREIGNESLMTTGNPGMKIIIRE